MKHGFILLLNKKILMGFRGAGWERYLWGEGGI